MSLPALLAVRRHAQRLTVMGRAYLEEFYEGFCDSYLPVNPGLRGAASQVRASRPDVMLLFQNSIQSALVSRLSGVAERWGYRRNGRGFLLTRAVAAPKDIHQAHQVYYYWDLVRSLGLTKGDPELAYSSDREPQIRSDERWVGMSPGARFGEAKRWPPESYVALGRGVVARGMRVAIFGSAAESGLCQSMADAIGNGAMSLAGRTSIRQLAADIAACKVFVANDSGPMHLATALRVPVVAIFGSTEPRSSRPFNPPSVVLHRRLPCSPCHLRRCPIDHRCMTRIHAEEAVAAVIRLAAI